MAGMSRHPGEMLLDVRGAEEREQLRIEPSLALPLPDLESGATTDMTGSEADLAEVVTVYCAKGPRSIRAAKLLRERGVNARYLLGGIEAFARLAPHLVTSGSELTRQTEPTRQTGPSAQKEAR